MSHLLLAILLLTTSGYEANDKYVGGGEREANSSPQAAG